jgi:hypothetical protein
MTARKLHLASIVATCLAAGLLFSTGCNRSTLSTVSGTVSFEGKPLASGSVMLYCEDRQIVHGLIGPDGTYSIPNVPRGTSRAVVRAHTPLPEGFQLKTKLPPMVNGPIGPPPGATSKDMLPPIPKRYELPEESGLVIRVENSSQHFDIILTR